MRQQVRDDVRSLAPAHRALLRERQDRAVTRLQVGKHLPGEGGGGNQGDAVVPRGLRAFSGGCHPNGQAGPRPFLPPCRNRMGMRGAPRIRRYAPILQKTGAFHQRARGPGWAYWRDERVQSARFGRLGNDTRKAGKARGDEGQATGQELGFPSPESDAELPWGLTCIPVQRGMGCPHGANADLAPLQCS